MTCKARLRSTRTCIPHLFQRSTGSIDIAQEDDEFSVMNFELRPAEGRSPRVYMQVAAVVSVPTNL